MCGINGLITNRSQEESCLIINQMNKTIAHRGPDDMGIWSDQLPNSRTIAFGHQRLSIMDLSPAGHQPMCNEDGTVWITFNGEIFNFLELKEQLQDSHQFRSSSDTEVIVHLYEELGIDCIQHLNGQFALAIYDNRPGINNSFGKLYFARDHLGIKPLYYTQSGNDFFFSSEIKAIISGHGRMFDINWQAVWDYFTYLHIPHPQTIYENVWQLPPGHFAEFDLKEHDLKVHSFWNFAESFEQDNLLQQKSVEEIREELRYLINDAIKRQMISDVPLGAFLSGGIDSSIIVGLMAQNSSQRIKTFTVLFEGQGVEFYNEKDTADLVVERWNTDHHEISIDISKPDELFNLISAFDQPFGNPTFYLSYLISKATREHVTVALSGAGGDELFAGYPRYKALSVARTMQYVPRPLIKTARQAVGLLPDDYSNPKMRRIKLFFEGIDSDFAKQYQKWTYYLDEPHKQNLLVHNRFDAVQDSTRMLRRWLDAAKRLEFRNQVQYADLKSFLTDNILEYTDRSSMKVALEIRVPLLDYRIAEYSLKMPYHYKLRQGNSKAIFKEAFRDLIPPENLNAPKKGFCPPLAVWMDSTLDGYFDTYMDQATVQQNGILRWEAINSLRQVHKKGKRDNSMELFSIIMFDVWYRKYILGEEVSL